MASGDHSLRPVCSCWMEKIHKAFEWKKKDFGDDAEEAMQFFNGPYDFMYGILGKGRDFTGDDELPPPSFRMTCNKVAELVQLFGPALYHRNPVRKVNPRKCPDLPPELLDAVFGISVDPFAQQMMMQLQQTQNREKAIDIARATLLQAYLNYTPEALDLKTESRWAIDEAIIKGMGCLWTELYRPAGSDMTMVGTFYDSVDNLLMDPDADSMHEVQWIARRCVKPYWECEKEFGLPDGSLKDKATLEGLNQQASVYSLGTVGDYRRKQGHTNDLIVFWKVYSKMGFGGRLTGIAENLKKPFEVYGNNCFLAICEAVPYPLNIPPPLDALALDEDPLVRMGAEKEISQRLRWPTPWWADDAWPMTDISFHPIPKKIWPMSHVKPGLGELKFLNWAYSFMAGKIRIASRDFIAVLKSASEDLKEKIKHGPDYTVIEVEQLHGDIDKVVKFLQHPGFNPEIYHVLKEVSDSFERRTGLTELMYGMSGKQMRSAQEATMKGDQASIRPEDMASRVEDAMSEIARKEALACRWHLTSKDVQPVLGTVGARWWDLFVVPSDPAEILHQLEYRIEAGSAKKPNKALEKENMQSAMQTLFPSLWGYAQATGNVGPLNNLIKAWAHSIDLDPTGFMIPQPPPMAPPTGPAPPGQGPPGAPPQGQPPANQPPPPQGGHP